MGAAPQSSVVEPLSALGIEDDYVLRRQLSANYQALPSVLLPAPFNAVIISLPLAGHVPASSLLVWVLLIVLQSAVGLGLRARYSKLGAGAPLQPWLSLRVAHAAWGGLAWGGYAAVLLWPEGQFELQVFVLLIVCLTSVGALVSTGMLFRAFAAYVLPCVLPCIVRFGSVPERAHLTSAVELTVLLGVLLTGGMAASRSSRSQLMLAQRNEALIGGLRRAEEELRVANRSLNERVEERTRELARAVEDKHASELQLLRAQKAEAIGRLAGGIAHDFNNVLTAIKGAASFLLEDMPSATEAAREEVEQILSASDRAARLTSQLLAFTRGKQGQPQRLDAAQQLEQLSHLLRRATGEGRRIEMVVVDTPLVIWIDPTQFDQLVMNLVWNAKDASPAGSTILVSLERAARRAPGPAAAPAQGDVLQLRVKDEGSGMSPEVVDRIFDPFFTTKGDRGTGLGLATCLGIVQRAEGRIEVSSELGQGSCFSVELPLIEGDANPETARQVSARPPTALRSVLVVEDQEAVLRIVATAMAKAGTRVHEARSAEEARALFARGIPDLDLVISDVLLPQQNGPDLIRELKAQGFAGACLLISGYVDDAAIVDRSTGESLPLLQKPFSVAELNQAVARVLATQLGAAHELAESAARAAPG